MNKIKKVSKFFRILFQIDFLALPILLAISWIYSPNGVFFHGLVIIEAISKHSYPILHDLGVHTKILGFMVNMIPTGINLLTLYFLIKLFKLYEKGEIFTINNVRYIRNIGYALVVGQVINPVYEALLSLVLTWDNPPHQNLRFVQVSVDQTNIGILLTGILVILISWIMAEGYKLNEEHQLTV